MIGLGDIFYAWPSPKNITSEPWSRAEASSIFTLSRLRQLCDAVIRGANWWIAVSHGEIALWFGATIQDASGKRRLRGIPYQKCSNLGGDWHPENFWCIECYGEKLGTILKQDYPKHGFFLFDITFFAAYG